VRSETLDYPRKRGEKGRLSAEKPVAKESPEASLRITRVLIAGDAKRAEAGEIGREGDVCRSEQRND
jgi:hypothetical protein